jgi:hypothetical protein
MMRFYNPNHQSGPMPQNSPQMQMQNMFNNMQMGGQFMPTPPPNFNPNNFAQFGSSQQPPQQFYGQTSPQNFQGWNQHNQGQGLWGEKKKE